MAKLDIMAGARTRSCHSFTLERSSILNYVRESVYGVCVLVLTTLHHPTATSPLRWSDTRLHFICTKLAQRICLINGFASYINRMPSSLSVCVCGCMFGMWHRARTHTMFIHTHPTLSPSHFTSQPSSWIYRGNQFEMRRMLTSKYLAVVLDCGMRRTVDDVKIGKA